MLEFDKALKILNSYNISSNNYGASIYQNKDEIGVVLDLKDSIFNYLTRSFSFNDENELDTFLKTYYAFKNNQSKFNLELSLNEYNTHSPKIIYKLDGEELTNDEILNLNNKIEAKKEEIINNNKRKVYLKNTEDLTKYLIDLLNKKEQIKKNKNKLKENENDLKYELLVALTTYYEKEKNIPKKSITKEVVNSVDSSILLSNLENIKTKNLNEVINYLNSLIDIIKKEEYEEKYLVNEYSNLVYNYNINILQKQIAFVNKKINAEKKFSLKGTKIHNIDEELKSFLKSEIAPENITKYLNSKKSELDNKYKNISVDNLNGFSTDNIINTDKVDTYYTSNMIIDELMNKYNLLAKNEQNTLILYNSFYKPICDYLIDNNYDISNIQNEFDFTYYYEEIESIIFNENNNHYLVNYFNNINFKDINSYINSLIELTKKFESINLSLISNLKTFSTNNLNTYKILTTTPILDNAYIITIPKNTQVKYVPFKLIINEDKEIELVSSNNIYLKATIIKTNNTLNLKTYNKKTKLKDKKSNLYIATNLEVAKDINYIIGTLGDINE